MKKLFFLSALLCASLVSFAAVDWSSVAWLGDGAGGGAYNEKYKAVVTPELTGGAGGFINNLQLRGETPVIHIAMPSAVFGACSLAEGQYEFEGAGFFPHLSAFTAQETEFTLVCQDVTYTFTVYYADGTATAVDNIEAAPKAVKLIENGQLVIIKNGVRYNAAGSQIK